MNPRIVTDGQDPLTKPCLSYLEAKYGIPASDCQNIVLSSPARGVQTLTVTLLVEEDWHAQPPIVRDAARSAARAVAFTRGARDGRQAYVEDPRLPLPGDATAVIPAYRLGDVVAAGDMTPLDPPISHAPTECTFQVQGAPCGELIRYSDVDGWYHVSDRHLGASAHPALPPL